MKVKKETNINVIVRDIFMEKIGKDKLIEILSDSLRAILTHYHLWFRETEHQLADLDKAIEKDDEVWKRFLTSFFRRMARRFGFELVNVNGLEVPDFIYNMSEDDLLELWSDLAKTWLAGDGLWFQAVERTEGMDTAKRVNDSCWVRFSYIEAKRIKRLLNLPENAGIDGLRKALLFRQYSRINRQEIVDVDEKTIIFRMNECRVQEARKSKGLPDYPCKSAGLVEYTRFAEAIDRRIRARCVACPPDEHPEDWWCAWEFRLEE